MPSLSPIAFPYSSTHARGGKRRGGHPRPTGGTLAPRARGKTALARSYVPLDGARPTRAWENARTLLVILLPRDTATGTALDSRDF
jgi:hypothetical protein